jgi:branched-chain amino acid transport system permease protein
VRAIDGVDLTVLEGQTHGLIGPNGSGKSTLVNVLTGLYPPKEGSMVFRGRELPRGSLYRTAHRGIARTFQNLQVFRELSVLGNVMVSLRGAYKSRLPELMLGLDRAEEQRAQARALALLGLVGLADQARQQAGSLSYGAQRFLEIARALALRPELLILDEPAAGLAHPDVQKLVAIIRRIQASGIAMVLIEHHMDVVCAVCDTVTVLDGGLVIAADRPEQIRSNPAVVRAYLGDSALTC